MQRTSSTARRIKKKKTLTNGWSTGLGEDVRGSVMGAFETVSGSEQGKAKEADIVSKGRSEIERGAAQMKGVAVPGSTTAGPESHVESKTGDQPEKQPAKQEVPISATAGPESPVEGKTDQPEKQPAKQEVPGPTPAPPPSPTQSRQAEPEPSRQVPAAQTGTENVQKSGQETKAGSSIYLVGCHVYLIPT